MNDLPDPLIPLLSRARRVVVVTGAGISAESGVPTFREARTGLWARYDPAELATAEAFRRNPDLVWRWYCWRRSQVLAVEPNAGHRAIADLQHRFPGFLLVTQNVDRLHQRAGSHAVVELHGNIMRARCFDNAHPVGDWPEPADNRVPVCPHCPSLLRPDVVWFGETLPRVALQQAEQAARDCDVLFSIGTSAVVYPAAALAGIALRQGATVVEINPEPTPLTARARFVLSGPAGVILPQLVARLAGAS